MTMHISPPAAATSDAGFHVRTLMRRTFVRRLAFTINWPAIERGLAAIVTDINKLDREIAMRTKAVEEWKLRNPWPVEPDYNSYNARIDDFDRMNRALAVHAIHYQNALIQCGRGAFQKRRLAALERYDAECEYIASLPTPSPDDVRQKVRIARMEPDGGPIHKALFDHLSGNA